MNAPDLNRMVAFLQSEVSFIQTTLKDKGSNRFSRPLALGAIIVLFSYWFIYSPPIKKLQGLNGRLRTARATAEYADQYKTIRERLFSLYELLPLPAGPSLTETLVDSLKAESIVADSLQPPAVAESAGMIFQSVSVTMTLKFSELTTWLLRIEEAKPRLHVSSLSIKKKTDALGKNEVTAVLTMVIPKERFQ